MDPVYTALKDTCLRLSGVFMMVVDMVDMAPDSHARQHPSRAIPLRIQEVLGDRVELEEDNIPGKIKIKIFNGYPQRDTVDGGLVRNERGETGEPLIIRPAETPLCVGVHG